MQFSAKCSERNSVRDKSQCLNTAVKYFCIAAGKWTIEKQY